jgi:hypothetical protein
MKQAAFPTVFISYAHEDLGAALRLSENLKKAGIQTWIDQEHLLPGQYWAVEIRHAIKRSEYFVALLSSRSVSKRGFVQREIRQALDIIEELPHYERYLLPVRIDDCLIEIEAMRGIQWVDLFPHWEVGINKLVHAIRSAERLPPTEGVQSASAIASDHADLRSTLLPAALVEEYLGLDLSARRRYRRRIAGGLGLIGLLVAIMLIVEWALGVEIMDDDGPIGVGGSMIGSGFVITGFYFIISGISRWRVSIKARRAVVIHNEPARAYLREEHGLTYRLLFGAWPWKLLWWTWIAASVPVGVLLSMFMVMGIVSLLRLEWFGLIVIALSAMMIALLALPFWRFSRAWLVAQRMAGVPGL